MRRPWPPPCVPRASDVPPHHDLSQFGIPVLDRVKDALVLNECAGPESDAVAAAAIEPQQRVKLIAEILDEERVSARPRDPEMEIPVGGTERIVNARLKPGDFRLMAADALGERLRCPRRSCSAQPRGRQGPQGPPAPHRSIAASRASPRRHAGPGSGRGYQMALLQPVQGLAQGSAADTVTLGKRRLADLRSERQLALEDCVRQAMEKLLGQRLARLRGITDRRSDEFQNHP